VGVQHIVMVVYVVAAVTALAWGVFVSLDSRREERWRGRFLAVWPFIVTLLATLYAAVASLGLAWLSVRIFESDPPTVVLAAIPAASAAVALYTWSTLRAPRDRSPRASTPDGLKPKPSDLLS
jgi:hypothetical protein